MTALKLVRNEQNDGYAVKEYACDFIAECDGTSIWSDTNGKRVRVTGICVIEEDGCDALQVNVEHDSGWEIYTDKGFERAISRAVGFDVSFTEQGMQDDEYASMEAC
jgi:hypothetical protein